jgi:hypothetical protein
MQAETGMERITGSRPRGASEPGVVCQPMCRARPDPNNDTGGSVIP